MSIQIIENQLKPNSKMSVRSKTTEIILHCTADPEGRDNTVESIDRTHKNSRGFSMIGYHFVIYRDGSVHRGRPEEAYGAHCTDHNHKAIGISYVGGCESTKRKDGKLHAKDTRTEEQEVAMYDLVHHLILKYKLSLDDVHCHYEYAKKACPSFKLEDFKKGYLHYFK